MSIGLSVRRSAGGITRDGAAARHSVARELIRLVLTAAPIIGVGLMNTAISVTNTAMMAYYDPAALAAGALVSDLYSIVFQFAAGALSSFTPLVAAAHARNDQRTVAGLVSHGLRIGAFIGASGFVLVFFSAALLGSIGVTLPLRDVAAEYARYMACAFVLMLGVAFARSIFPAIGQGAVPLVVMVVAVPVNALANAILMYGWFGVPAMGLSGSGAASLIVAALSAGALTIYAAAAPSLRALRHGFAGRLKPVGRALLGNAVVTGAASLFETGVFLSSTVLVGAFAAQALPAHVVVFRTLAISYVILVGFGQAVTIHMADVRAIASPARQSAVRNAAMSGTFLLAALYVVALNCVPEIGAAFARGGSAAPALDALAPWAAIASASLVFSVIAFSILRAHTDVSAPTAIGFFGYWIVGFASMLVLAGPWGYGAVGIWMGLAAGSSTTAIGSWVYLAFARSVR